MLDTTVEWLDRNAKDRAPVFLSSEIPDDVRRALGAEGLIRKVPGGLAVLRSPKDPEIEVLRSVFWVIVQRLTEVYAPAVVERDSAVRLHMGRTDPAGEVRIRHAGKSRWTEEILPGVSIRLDCGPVYESAEIQAGEATVPVDSSESVLLSMPLSFLRDGGLDEVALWMKSLHLSEESLTEAYRRNPRPVVLERMGHIARDVGNDRLADLISDVVASQQNVRIGRDRTGVGRTLIVPPRIVRSETTHRPWLDRLSVLIDTSIRSIREIATDVEEIRSNSNFEQRIENARAQKVHDAYHSTSIEGYRLSIEEVAALLGGEGSNGADPEDLRARMAVAGYGVAFDLLMKRVAANPYDLHLDSSLALDLYSALFAPSVEAGIVSAEELGRWRTQPVFMRGTLYVPPAPDKIESMLSLLWSKLDPLSHDEGLLRATLVHLWFVWIHPFPDGNGRIARFLMNAALLSSGLPAWTIRVEQRGRYFAALRAAQLDEEFEEFGRFVVEGVGEARAVRLSE